jgi:ATP-dependent DNA helicase RecG
MPSGVQTETNLLNLQSPVSDVPGVGPKKKVALENIGVTKVKDLLYYLPNTYRDTTEIITLEELLQSEEKEGTVNVSVSQVNHTYIGGRRSIFKAMVEDETGRATVMWFNQPFMQRVVKRGYQFLMTLKLPQKEGAKDYYCKDLERLDNAESEGHHLGKIAPIYSQTSGITTKWLRGRIEWIFDNNPTLIKEWLPKQSPELYPALKQVHFPDEQENLDLAKKRLALEEMIELAYTLHERKLQINPGKASILNLTPEFKKEFIDSLPFKLTEDQDNSILEILENLHHDKPMYRLLNGDVGAGKTIVATVAILAALQSGQNVIFMAPTTILAQQHYKSLSKLLSKYEEKLGFEIKLLTSDTQEDSIKETGKPRLLISTHAILFKHELQKDVALIIVDEQHRFGVEQREKLLNSSKTHAPHYMHMTATPIPRTLTNILYQEESISEIRQKPKHQLPIISKLIGKTKRESCYKWVNEQIIKSNKQEQAFVIMPLVEETESLLRSVVSETKALQETHFKDLKIAAIHGRLKDAEKQEIMKKFANKEINVLIATTVVEVGMDFPDATMMIIENAERYGLAQLHQLRGRVGRGEKESHCFVIPGDDVEADSNAAKRLKYFVKHDSGFDLAEFDLKSRGPGELYGNKQSGIPILKMANIFDMDLLTKAREIIQETDYKEPPYNLLNLY